MKIGTKLTISFFVVAAVSMLVIGVISFFKGRDALKKESFNKLLAVREAKEDQIEDYFQQIDNQVLTLSEDPTIISAMREFRTSFNSIDKDLSIDDNKMKSLDLSLNGYFKKEYLPRLNKTLGHKATLESESNNVKNGRILQSIFISLNGNPVGEKSELDDPGDGSTYAKVHNYYHHIFRKFEQKFGYYDIMLVDDSTGNIVYTCEKEVDFGTSLLTGPFRESNIAKSFVAAKNATEKDSVYFVDFAPYHPSYNIPSSFVSAPIYDGDKKIGVLIFQMPIHEINDIMTNDQFWGEVGLEKTGETYIMGEDFKIRNQSRVLIEDSARYFQLLSALKTDQSTIEAIRNFNSSVGLQEIRTEGTTAALKGEDGLVIYDGPYGDPVLASYGPLSVNGMHWAIMSELNETEALSNIYQLRRQILLAFIILLFIVAAFSIFMSRRTTRPINLLTSDAMELAKGNFNVDIQIKRKDEIGILATSFRKMQSSIKNLVDELKNINQNLEQKVDERTAEVTHQKELLEHQNKEIIDSINYALRLQKAILPPHVNIDAALKESFVLFKPKDIVSGDFYWISHKEEEVLVAAVDCTGHGVPGALVSMVGSNNLDRCVGEFGLRKPSDILDKLKELVVATFDSTHDDEVKDGMDIALVSLRYISNVGPAHERIGVVNYSGANNPLWIIRKDAKPPIAGEEGDIFEIKADKQPIGKFDYGKPFTNHEVDVHAGDCIYIFTDGYADQFGGPQGKKFRYKTLKNLLLQIHHLPMKEQRDILDKTFEDWRGDLQQIDDVCVMGLRV